MSSTEDQQHTLGQVLELVVLLHADMTASLARDGLTEARTRVLWQVGANGPSTQKTLADSIGVSPRNITSLVDGLVSTGFVTREPHPTDRRAIDVTLTRKGEAMARKLQQGADQLAAELFAEMPDHRLKGLSAGLTDVLDRLRDLIAADAAERTGH